MMAISHTIIKKGFKLCTNTINTLITNTTVMSGKTKNVFQKLISRMKGVDEKT